MTLTLMEGAIDTLKGLLVENLPARLDILDAEYTDSIVLEDIKRWYTAEQAAIPEYPSGMLISEATVVDGEGGGWMKADNQITIAYLVTDADTEILKRKLWRYVRATVEVLIAARSAPGWAYIVNFERFDYSPLYARDSQFLGDARVIVRLKKTDSV